MIVVKFLNSNSTTNSFQHFNLPCFITSYKVTMRKIENLKWCTTVYISGNRMNTAIYILVFEASNSKTDER